MKALALNAAKFGVSLAIIGYLVYHARNTDGFADVVSRPKRWDLLLCAWLLLMAAVCTTIVRWYALVRALGLPFRLRDAFRLGFLGYLFNFVSLGSVGGDLFKAVFLAHEQPGRRVEAVATIAADRLVGMYGLLLVAGAAVLGTGQWHSPVENVRIISKAALVVLGLATLAVAVVLTPRFTEGRLAAWLCRLRLSGRLNSRLLGAVRMYRTRMPVLGLACALSVGVHCLSSVGIYLVARGLPGEAPTLSAHFVIVPLGMVCGILPLPMSGLGAFEAVLDFFYVNMPGGAAIAAGRGLIVALGYRLMTVGIAIVGMFYYLASRREVAVLMHESREPADDAAQPGESAASPSGAAASLSHRQHSVDCHAG